MLKGKWKPVTSDKIEYFHFGKDAIEMDVNLLPERTEFWASTIKSRKNYAMKDEL